MIKELRQRFQRTYTLELVWELWKQRFIKGKVAGKFPLAEDLLEERKNGHQ